jgi:hypothetical protein
LPAPPPPPRHRAGPPHWMVDFIASHQQPGRRPPVVTGAERPSAVGGPPTWMSDFDHQENRPDGDKEAPAKSPRPDWMKDFES